MLLLTVTLTSQLLGHSVFNHLLANTSPMLVSLALLLEVPGASLIAAVILGQVPSPAAVAGLLVVLAGHGAGGRRQPGRRRAAGAGRLTG